jgi:hypothetical protein
LIRGKLLSLLIRTYGTLIWIRDEMKVPTDEKGEPPIECCLCPIPWFSINFDQVRHILLPNILLKQRGHSLIRGKGPSHPRPPLASSQISDSEIIKYYKIVHLKRGHSSYKATFPLQKGWSYKKGNYCYVSLWYLYSSQNDNWNLLTGSNQILEFIFI